MRTRNAARRRAGFTLIELITAVVIIAALAAIAIPNYLYAQLRSKRSELPANVGAILNLQKVYEAQNNSVVTAPATPASTPDRFQAPWVETTPGKPFEQLGYKADSAVYCRYSTGEVGGTIVSSAQIAQAQANVNAAQANANTAFANAATNVFFSLTGLGATPPTQAAINQGIFALAALLPTTSGGLSGSSASPSAIAGVLNGVFGAYGVNYQVGVPDWAAAPPGTNLLIYGPAAAYQAVFNGFVPLGQAVVAAQQALASAQATLASLQGQASSATGGPLLVFATGECDIDGDGRTMFLTRYWDATQAFNAPADVVSWAQPGGGNIY